MEQLYKVIRKQEINISCKNMDDSFQIHIRFLFLGLCLLTGTSKLGRLKTYTNIKKDTSKQWCTALHIHASEYKNHHIGIKVKKYASGFNKIVNYYPLKLFLTIND